jgi:hypothetical protein
VPERGIPVFRMNQNVSLVQGNNPGTPLYYPAFSSGNPALSGSSAEIHDRLEGYGYCPANHQGLDSGHPDNNGEWRARFHVGRGGYNDAELFVGLKDIVGIGGRAGKHAFFCEDRPSRSERDAGRIRVFSCGYFSRILTDFFAASYIKPSA